MKKIEKKSAFNAQNHFIKKENGAIAIFVLIALLFISAFLILSFSSNINLYKDVQEQFNVVGEIYTDRDGVEGAYDRAYAKIKEEPEVETSKDTGTLGTAVDSTNYGKKVNFVSKGDGLDTLVWRIFYKDDKNVYLISETEAGDYPVTSLPFYDFDGSAYTKKDIVQNYNGGGDVSTQGQNLMPLAKENNVFTDNTNYNIIATAYMCDTSEGGPWDNYLDAGGKAAWAMGSPTLELFAKSYDATHNTTTALTISNKGYDKILSSGNSFSTENNKIYRLKSSGVWWLASPFCSTDGAYLCRVNDSSGFLDSGGVEGSRGARPIVCIPVKNFSSFTVSN